MAPTFDAKSTNFSTASNTVSVNHTAGSGAKAIVEICWYDETTSSAPTVSSLTVGGSSSGVTFKQRNQFNFGGDNYLITELWHVDNAPASSTAYAATVSETMDASDILFITVTSYTGAGGVGANFGTGAANSAAPSCTFTTGASSSLIVGAFSSQLWASSTPGTGVTEREDTTNGASPYNGIWVGEKAASGGSDTFNATLSTGTRWSIVALELQAGAAGPTEITPAEATQAQTSDAVTVKAIYAVTPAEATQAQTSDLAVLSYLLSPAEATQAQASDAASIVAISPITPAEATQAQSSDAATLTAIYLVTPAEATQAQASDAATLTAIYLVTPAEATQSQTSDAAEITFQAPGGAINITPAEATQAQTSDAVTLTAIYLLTPAEATQAQTSDAVTLSAVYLVTPAEATQAQASDAVSLTYHEPTYPITPAEATQSQTSDIVSITPIYVVSVADATQAQTSDAAELSVSAVLVSLVDLTVPARDITLVVLDRPGVFEI